MSKAVSEAAKLVSGLSLAAVDDFAKIIEGNVNTIPRWLPLKARLERAIFMDWRERVTVNPQVCHGKACIAGTRVMISVILDNLADEVSPEEILSSYPSLSRDDIARAISYAADLTREQFVLFRRGYIG